MNSIKFLVLAALLSAIGYLRLGFTVQYKSVGVLPRLVILLFIDSFLRALLSKIFANKIRSAVISGATVLKWDRNYAVPQSCSIVT